MDTQSPTDNPQTKTTAEPPISDKSRIVYIILGIFLGTFGVHNLYAGYIARGIAQLLLTMLSLGILSLITTPWVILEICLIEYDGEGKRMLLR